MVILAQIIGYIGMACAIVSFQSNRKNIIILFQTLTGVFFAIHFCMLAFFDDRDTVTGMILNIIAVARGLMYSYPCEKRTYQMSLPWFFSIVSLVAGYFTWANYLSLLPVASMVISSFAFWVKNTTFVRFLSLPASALWIVYNLVNHSWAGFCTELFVTTSLLVAIFRFDRKKLFSSEK